ncbi:hypothetical protein WSM22_12780 [Cytophagales bacterium WSM2-2]|nr:hypothetical protein WSM22_12780 [Cytophagales bacterium WSM2-2]
MEKPIKIDAGRNLGVTSIVIASIAIVFFILGLLGTLPVACLGALSVLFGVIGIIQATRDNGKKVIPLTGLILGAFITLLCLGSLVFQML